MRGSPGSNRWNASPWRRPPSPFRCTESDSSRAPFGIKGGLPFPFSMEVQWERRAVTWG